MSLPPGIPKIVVVFTWAGPGDWVDQEWKPSGEPETRSLTVCVQQLTPREAERLPEGWRNKEAVRVYSSSRLNGVVDSGGDGNKSKGDRFPWNGRQYEVQKSELWEHPRLGHWKSIALLVSDDTRPEGD